MSYDNTTLPPGWEAKFDLTNGKRYYINHNDKTTHWDHPHKNKKTSSVTQKSISKQSNGTSKHFSNVGVENIPLQDFSSKTRGSPLTVRSKLQESPLTNAVDTDEAVSKISAMFPTVSDAHIRLLMKNCRYMKSIFPQAEETIILDILYNNDNNIQRSSEKLREMGFEKKDSLKISQQKQQAKMKAETSKSPPPKSPVPIPKVKTADEKAKVKLQLQQDYKDTPEQLITMALESVDFDKEKANNLLKSIIDDLAKSEEVKIVETSEVDNKGTPNNKESTIPVSQSRQSLKSLLKSDKCDKEKSIFNRVIEESNLGHKSAYLSNTRGANPDLAKGKNDKLLLEDYINWHGPDPIIRKGPNQGLAKGPNLSYKQERTAACGPNANFHKGPNRSLVKGSIFQQMKAVVSVGGESRGK